MKTIKIPYYTDYLDLNIEEKNLKAVVTASTHEFRTDKPQDTIIRDALENPIGSVRLRDLAVGKKKIVLIKFQLITYYNLLVFKK